MPVNDRRLSQRIRQAHVEALSGMERDPRRAVVARKAEDARRLAVDVEGPPDRIQSGGVRGRRRRSLRPGGRAKEWRHSAADCGKFQELTTVHEVLGFGLIEPPRRRRAGARRVAAAGFIGNANGGLAAAREVSNGKFWRTCGGRNGNAVDPSVQRNAHPRGFRSAPILGVRTGENRDRGHRATGANTRAVVTAPMMTAHVFITFAYNSREGRPPTLIARKRTRPRPRPHE